jgi:allantoinase
MHLIVRGRRVVLPDGVHPAAIHVRDGVVAHVTDHSDVPSGAQVVDAGDLTVSPGIVDTHVHVNEPGRTDWEGFEHATRAAAAGGVTTIVDMPLNSIPATTSVAALETKRAAAKGQCWVDVGFWGGVVPGNLDDLPGLARAGVLGFKCFLVPSGVDEFQHVSEQDLRAAAAVLADLRVPLLVHAESPAALRPIDPRTDPRRYVTWLDSRPVECETTAIAMVIDVVRRSGARMHIVHLAAAPAIASLREARRERLSISVETCPHYLFFEAGEIGDGDTTLKCAPPIRDSSNRDRLWQALLDGDIDLIATDHSPAPPALKQLDTGDFVQAWGGIASLQLGLAAVWTTASARGAGVDRLARWMSAAPAKLAGLDRAKGAIAPGFDADLVIWNPEAEWEVVPSRLHHRHAATPYAGRRLRGQVVRTFLRGREIFNGAVLDPPHGRLLVRPS